MSINHPGEHDGDQGVVDRLGRDLAGLDGLGLVGDERADVVDRERSEPRIGERGQQPLAAADLIAAPSARLEVGSAAAQPALPVAAERLGGVDDLTALDLLDSRRRASAAAR